jgi:hypothetical protein
MPKKNRNKAFPHIASLPSIKIDYVDEIPLRSIEAENLRDLASFTEPHGKRLEGNSRGDRNSRGGRWSPISISSEEEDYESEMMDMVADEMKGKFIEKYF